MPIAAGCWVFPKFAMASMVAWATVAAAVSSFHCVGELPSSANRVGTFREGPWWVHS